MEVCNVISRYVFKIKIHFQAKKFHLYLFARVVYFCSHRHAYASIAIEGMRFGKFPILQYYV